ncbi:MAG: Flagella synthesis protein FlgN [Candidatus Erwinia impunctatus]|nr:Flagella synthesis protein FlgN [Culicoides impunctatus]
MQALLNTLDGMLKVLSDLQRVMDAEQAQLSAGTINSSHLQQITEDKTALLATLDFLSSSVNKLPKIQAYKRPTHQRQRWLNAGKPSSEKSMR